MDNYIINSLNTLFNRNSKTIYDCEKEILELQRNTYSKEEQDAFVEDGLCWASISKDLPDRDNRNWPECLWTDANRRVLFLLKEPNQNEGEDYKDWDWAEGTDQFGNVLAYWLEGILRTKSNYSPTYNDISFRKDIFSKFPLAICNLKKIAGDSQADWKEIWEYAERDKEFLRRQIREILRPNIIVCGGSNDSNDSYKKVLTIALEIIYPDLKTEFKRINSWCYFNSKEDILLIDSYHPSYYAIKEQDKIEWLIKGYQEFILAVNYTH